jgi:hypothetical protein
VRLPFQLILRVFHRSLLGCASLLLSKKPREEWCREWQGELWQACIARTPMEGFSWSGEREVVEFCLGAFPDALCLRSQETQTRALFSSRIPQMGPNRRRSQCYKGDAQHLDKFKRMVKLCVRFAVHCAFSRVRRLRLVFPANAVIRLACGVHGGSNPLV